LSIIVPTRSSEPHINRTLINLLKSPDQRFEVVLNDNSYPEVIDYSEFLKDPRFKLFTNDSYFTMSENFLLGLKHSQGKWVCFAGSDDGVVDKNITIFLDFLEQCTSMAVTTISLYFQELIGEELPWLTHPINKSKLFSRSVKFHPFLSAFFPQLEFDLPRPYNKAVVRKQVFDDYLPFWSRIPGMSHDQFLAQFIAQKVKSGIYLDLAVFISGGSGRSNGHQINNSLEKTQNPFSLDSIPYIGNCVKKFGMSCRPALTIDHYIAAKKILGKRHFFLPMFTSHLWCFLTCVDFGHHKNFFYVKTYKLRKMSVEFFAYGLRKGLNLLKYGRVQPTKTFRFEVPLDSNILDASAIFSNIDRSD
jgi:hypothetical protein